MTSFNQAVINLKIREVLDPSATTMSIKNASVYKVAEEKCFPSQRELCWMFAHELQYGTISAFDRIISTFCLWWLSNLL